jgi:hypothetical protein
MTKFNVKDLEKALEYMKNKVYAVQIGLEFDDRNRLMIQTNDMSANQVTITVYAAEAAKMPEITETKRL